MRLLSLVSMPVLTHLLTPGAYGAAAMATTLVSLLSVFALAGADVSYVRAYLAGENENKAAIENFTWRFALSSAILAAALSFAFWKPISNSLSLARYAGWFVAMGTILSVIMAMAVSRARLGDRYRALSIATVAGGLSSTAAGIAIAYFVRQDELPLLVSMIAGYLIPVLILGIPRLPALLKPSGVTFGNARQILSINFASIVAAPAYALITTSDRWFLGYFHDAASAGIYSVGYSVAIIGMTVNAAMLTIWIPEATRIFETRASSGNKQLAEITEGMIAVFACVWLAVTAAGGDILRLLSAPAFHAGAAVIPFIAGAVFFHGVTHLANTVYLLEKRVHRTISWWVAGAVACLFFNLVLVPFAGMLGAAASQLLAFMIVALGLSIDSRRMFAGDMNWIRVLTVLFIVLAGAAIMVPAWAENPLISLLMKFPAGLTIAILIASLFGGAPLIAAVSAKTRSGRLGWGRISAVITNHDRR